ncbi:hypothetical protein CCACVL1_17734 [Corchorus capsularis]|uniref:Uncharacterized protein n=1 Tax=Corchorus capsularis TaxID=210143 RepID=A0A1R3HQM1_COCAP|nr:hypothetical protein CCACVL1_17734 [Corchorus capsularis]
MASVPAYKKTIVCYWVDSSSGI